MEEEPHDRALRHVLHRGHALYLRGENKHLAGSQERLAILRSPSSSGNPSSKRTIRRPDVGIGRPVSPETREQRSPKSKRITHPLPGRVDTVVEVTSKNESTDTVVKVAKYERAGVNTYVVINTDSQCKNEDKRDKRVEVYRRNPTTNSWGSREVYRGETPVDTGLFGVDTPNNLQNPNPSAPFDERAKEWEKDRKEKQAARKREKKALKEEQADLKREQEALKEEQADLKREQEALKEEQAALAQKRHYKDSVRKNLPDEVTSSTNGSQSSSKTSSPVQKRSRRKS
ncbi:Restriction endonuclease type II-like protein [Gracilaria domingensis]|nr:Restriction endonuclease type II-like protein [Gracilaria domingensis]